MKNLTGYNDYINESKLQEDYRDFFSKLLDLYGIKSPAVFKNKPEDAKKFYGEISKGWSKGNGLTDYGKKLMDLEELVELNEWVRGVDVSDFSNDKLEKQYKKVIKELEENPEDFTLKDFKLVFSEELDKRNIKINEELKKLEEVNESIIDLSKIGFNDKNRYNNFIYDYNKLIKKWEVGIGIYDNTLSLLDVNTNNAIFIKDSDDLTINFD